MLSVKWNGKKNKKTTPIVTPNKVLIAPVNKKRTNTCDLYIFINSLSTVNLLRWFDGKSSKLL